MYCWISKLLPERTGKDRPNLLRRRHEAECPHCRAYSTAYAKLPEALRAEASKARVEESPYLASRIVANLSTRSESQPTGGWLLPWRSALAVAGLAAAATILVTFSHRDDPSPATQQAALPAPAKSAPLSLPTADILKEMAARLDDPLELEMQRVAEDARKAVTMLAQNFLPSQGQ